MIGMNDPVLGRLLWKEYRTHRSFWIAYAAFSLLVQAYLIWVNEDANRELFDIYSAAFVLPAFYALGCAAVSFSLERENGTHELLRNLSTPPNRVFAGKLGFALASTFLMAAVLWALAWLWASGTLPEPVAKWAEKPPATLGQVCGTWSLICLELVAWGLFFSLLTHRPLNAVCMAAGAMLCSSYLLAIAGRFASRLLPVPYDETISTDVFSRIPFLGLLFLVDGWLAHRWLLGGGINVGTLARLERFPISAGRKPAAGRTRKSPLRHLVWHEWRQARTSLLVVGASMVLVTAGAAMYWPNGSELVLYLVPAAASLMGTMAFHGEQAQHRFRYLAERGVSPPAVWLSKHIVWLPATLASVAFCLLVCLVVVEHLGSFGSRSLGVGGFLLLSFAGYASGQLFSMLVRQPMLAAFLGIIVALVQMGWMELMVALAVPLLWSVAPFPLILLAATLVRCRGWMLERHTVRDWGRFLATIIFPVAMTLATVATYRVSEIPSYGPGFDVAEFARPVTQEEAETARLYGRAIAAIRGSWRGYDVEPSKTARDGWNHATPAERRWLGDNEEALRLTLEAAQRPRCVFDDPSQMRITSRLAAGQAGQLGTLLLLSARELESRGDLDGALARYQAALALARHVVTRGGTLPWMIGQHVVRRVCDWMPLWASHAEQSEERVQRALRAVEEESSKFPPLTDATKAEHLCFRSTLLGDWADADAAMSSLIVRGGHWSGEDMEMSWQLYVRLFPWERSRALLLLDAYTMKSLRALEARLLALRQQGTELWSDPARTPNRDPFGEPPGKWIPTTYPPLMTAGLDESTLLERHEMRWRALRILLALGAWRLDHGQLPDRLERLAGVYFDRVPLDPWTGQDFGYQPRGFPHLMEFGIPSEPIPPNVPVLWSSGPTYARIVQSGVTEEGTPTYVLDYPPGTDRRGKLGPRAFLIPEAGSAER